MYKRTRQVKLKLISLLKNLLYLTICAALFYTYPISSELVADAYDEEGDLLLYFHAQRSFNPLDIVLYISEKGRDGIHPYVVLLVWDCEKRVDDLYDWFDSIFFSNKKARSLRECKEDTESIRQSLYTLQGVSAQHSRIKRKLDQLKNEIDIHVNHLRNARKDQKQEHQMIKSLHILKTSLISLLDYQNRSDNFLQKIRNYLSQNPIDTIDQWINFFQNFNEDNEIFESILSELKLFRSTTTGDRNKILNALNSFFREDSNNSLVSINLSDEHKNKIRSLQDDLLESYEIIHQIINLEHLIRQSIENWESENVGNDFPTLEKTLKDWNEVFYNIRKNIHYSIVQFILKFFFPDEAIEIPNEIKEIITSNSEIQLHQIRQLIDFIQSNDSSNYISSYFSNTYQSNNPLHIDDFLLHEYEIQYILSNIKRSFNIEEIQTQVLTQIQNIKAWLTVNTQHNEPQLISSINDMEFQLNLLSEKNMYNRIISSVDEVSELFAQLKVEVNNNYRKSSSYKLFETINSMMDHHESRSTTLSGRAIELDYRIADLRDEIRKNQEDILKVWDIKDKRQLAFTESIPAFSFSFMLYPLPVWALSDEEIEWMRRQDAFIQAFNQMREAGRRAYGR